MAFIDDIRSWTRRTGAPATVAILAGLVGVSLFVWLFRATALGLIAALDMRDGWMTHPWSLLTYPFAYAGIGPGLIFFIFLCLWIFWVGGAVEREVGTPRFLSIWATATVIPGLLIWLISRLSGAEMPPMNGPELPVAALTVIWGVRNPNLTVMLMMFIPVKAIWIAWVTIPLTAVSFGIALPQVGLAAIVHLGVAYVYALGRLPGLPYARASAIKYRPSKQQQRKENEFFEDIRRREQERAEKERLRRLFENSLNDDSK